MKGNLKTLREIMDEMVLYWSSKKMEVCDFEEGESWIVETLDPDKFTAFYDALDRFFVAFKEMEAELHETHEKSIKGEIFQEPQVYVVHYVDKREPTVYIKLKELLGES